MYKRILFASDLVAENTQAAEKAAKIAKNQNAELFLVHVVELPQSNFYAASLGFAEFSKPDKTAATQVLASLGELLDIPIERHRVRIGSVKHEILYVANDIKADLIVLGSHGAHGLNHLLGSTTNAILHGAKIDVLVVRTK